MKLIKVKDYDEMSREAAKIIAAQVLLQPRCTLGFATGSTPEGIYALLAEWHSKGRGLDFSQVTAFNLDEYEGLKPEDDQSYAYFMRDKLFRHINISPERTNIPNGLAADAAAECARYETAIANAGGIDLQLLGLGVEGHIGFCEPADGFAPKTFRVELDESTLNANARFFENALDMPRRAFTMGVGTILRARRILLIASGAKKAGAVKNAVCGPVTPRVAASALQLHGDVTVIGDEDAFSLLPKELF